ncbi:glycosyltransferase family 4 protein [Serratia marcescens]|uniref:glycosyltransferase family 4 protein n=1 Tax=Serratia marcescens TaxID=615 RepID=UPI000F7F3E49|nr:glycosyltransferase family 4 protein [Serratia marcescens]RTF46874.1 glycosyltransferase [Serratia marcescens]
MKIMIVNTLYSPYKIGGAEVSVQILAEELVAQGNDVIVITLHEGAKRKESKINGVSIVYLPLKNIYWPFSGHSRGPLSKLLWHIVDNYNPIMGKYFHAELKRFKPDVVHTNNISGFSVAIWGRVKRENIKLIHTARDYYLFHPNTTLFSYGSNASEKSTGVKVWSYIKRRQSRKVDAFVGISDFIRRFHIEAGFFSKSKSTYIYNAVSPSCYEYPVMGSSEEIRVGFIGRLTADKGFESYCQIVEKLKDRGHKVLAFSAGRYGIDKNSEQLKLLAEKNNIEHLGFAKLTDFLSHVDIVILPIKWREPFGRVVVECALAGKMVLTNSVGGITELIALIPTVVDLKEGEINLKEPLVLGGEERDKCIDRFGQLNMTKDYLSVYNDDGNNS